MKCKVRLLSGLLTLLILGSFVCGCADSSDKYSCITIDNKVYDLSDKPETVIAKMVKNDNLVYDSFVFGVYDEIGNLSDESIESIKLYGDSTSQTVTFSMNKCESVPEDELERILCSERQYSFSWNRLEPHDLRLNSQVKLGNAVDDLFSITLPYINSDNIEEDFKSAGVFSLQDLNDKCNLPGFYSQLYFHGINLGAVYFDGKPVDIYKYMPDVLTEDDINKYQNVKIFNSHNILPIITYVYDGNNSVTIDDLTPLWRESHMFYYAYYYAIADGALKIRDGEISEVTAVSIAMAMNDYSNEIRRCSVSVMQKNGALLMKSENGEYYWN